MSFGTHEMTPTITRQSLSNKESVFSLGLSGRMETAIDARRKATYLGRWFAALLAAC